MFATFVIFIYYGTHTHTHKHTHTHHRAIERGGEADLITKDQLASSRHGLIRGPVRTGIMCVN